MENKIYSEQDVHYDTYQFLMLDKDNQPITGTVKVLFDDKSIHKEMPYVAGKKHGVETWYWPNGNKRFIVHWENGLRNGSLEEFRQDGTKSLMRTYVNNQREGKQIVYHLNGNEKRTFYIHDGRETAGEYNYETGKSANEVKEPQRGKKEETTHYENGQLKYVGVQDSHNKMVTRTLYYRNGQIALEMTKTKDGVDGYIYSLSGTKTKLTPDKAAEIDLFFMHGFFRHPDTENGWDKLTKRFLRILL